MDNKNDILHTLRERKDDYHLPLREGGWEKLEAELASRPVVLRRGSFRRWLAVAAVALLAIALSVPMFLQQEAVEVVADNRAVPSVDPDQAGAVRSVSTDTLTTVLPQPSLKEPARQEAEVPPIPVVSESPVIADVAVVAATPEKEEAATPSPSKRMGPEPESRPSLPQDALAETPHPSRRHADDWSLGLQAGSGKTVSGFNLNDLPLDGNMSDPNPPGKPDPDPDPDDPEPGNPDPDKPEVETRAMPQPVLRSSPPLQYHHRMPLTVGLSVRKRFTDQFALESGLSYTYLYSDISQQGCAGYTGNQRIHYLGIPLKANWTFYRKGALSLYLAGGMMVEYAISARRNVQGECQPLDMNRWQLSFNGSVGAEVQLIRPVSLYLEPGVGYYFDSGSDVPTIRMERPWLFGLQVGLRFTY